ncbi:MBL fold metallo-hydrolase [Microbacterium sp. MC2]
MTPVEIAPGVHVRTSRIMHTTSTTLVGEGRALLVDPGWMPDDLAALAAQLRGLDIVGGFATHAHHDHLLWHPGFGEAPRWASAETARLAHAERETLAAALGAEFPAELVALMGQVSAVPGALPTASTPPGFEIELVVHDGHAPGHTALWLPRQRVLIAGDMLSDIELPLPFSPDDVPAYRAALDRLAPYAARAAWVVPGHGTVGTDAQARLDADRRVFDDLARTGTSADARRANEGMAETYRALQALLR